MSKVTSNDEVVTKAELAEFYQKIFPYLGGNKAVDSSPIGTVISYMGATPPAGYLACDGSKLSATAFPLLFDVLKTLPSATRSTWGDADWVTEFNVPNLQGEFLRGTGTNSHSGQGNGANVGQHQDATVHMQINGHPEYGAQFQSIDNGEWYGGNNADRYYTNPNHKWLNVTSYASGIDPNSALGYSSRPTNTSVLYCIKYTYVTQEVEYSETEHVVGTWIDGKTVYEKTNTFTLPTVTSGSLIDYGALSASNVDEIINVECMVDMQVGNYTVSVPVFGAYGVTANKDLGDTICWAINKHNTNKDMSLHINTATSQFSEAIGKATVLYTKTQ